MSGSYRGERTGSYTGQDVLQKGGISSRLPRDWRAGLVSKTRPINRNGGEVGREPFLKRPHFSSRRDRAERGKQKEGRSYSEAVISDPNLLIFQLQIMQSESGFTLLSYVTPPSSGSGIALVAMLRFVPLVSRSKPRRVVTLIAGRCRGVVSRPDL